MNTELLLWPFVAQIVLTLLMYILLAVRKAGALKAGGVDRQQTALNNAAWPESVVKVSNNIANQFESPLLFYVLCLALFALNAVNVLVLSLAWVYVLSRYLHAFVHTGSNRVPIRLRLFLVGFAALIGLTVILVLRLI